MEKFNSGKYKKILQMCDLHFCAIIVKQMCVFCSCSYHDLPLSLQRTWYFLIPEMYPKYPVFYLISRYDSI